ncbi:vascular endothelial growth factor receptor 1 isoform X1, partial [Lates japonicus]
MLIICTICVPDRSVWVSDSQQPFVERPGVSPDVLYLKTGEQLVIPCPVTHPNVTTTLVK